MLSSTVTTAVQASVLPVLSVTISVTVLLPRFAQVKSVTSSARLATVQLSVLPASMSSGVMEALPVLFSCTVISRHTVVGADVSSTVTVVSQLALFPDVSVTARVTLTLPRSVCVKVSGKTVMSAISQLSVLPRAMASTSVCVSV